MAGVCSEGGTKDSELIERESKHELVRWLQD
jgi:hypothetical protein